jgi:hypothetical protein
LKTAIATGNYSCKLLLYRVTPALSSTDIAEPEPHHFGGIKNKLLCGFGPNNDVEN